MNDDNLNPRPTARRFFWLGLSAVGVLSAIGLAAATVGSSPASAAVWNAVSEHRRGATDGHERAERRAEHAARWLLRKVDASEQQEQAIQQIISREIEAMHALRDDASLDGNARLLRRMLRNLLENARRYATEADSPVEVELAGDAQVLIVRVCDRGPGVAEAERERIFEPFYRPGGMRETGEGAGLGLALVRQIAELHQGSARCYPRDGGGSCFEIRLRRAPD